VLSVVGQWPYDQLAQPGAQRVVALQREQRRQRADALTQVGTGGLTGLARVAEHVDQVVGELEGHPHHLAVTREHPYRLGVGPGDERTEPRAGRDQRTGLVGDDLQVVRDGVLALGRASRLGDLAFDESGEGAGLDLDSLGTQVGHHVGGPRKQEVTGQDGDGVGPPGIGARRTAPYDGLVHDVVVIQTAEVGELDDQRRLDDLRCGRIAEVRGEQREQWPEPLAAGCRQMARRRTEQRMTGVGDLAQPCLHVRQGATKLAGQHGVGAVEGVRYVAGGRGRRCDRSGDGHRRGLSSSGVIW